MKPNLTAGRYGAPTIALLLINAVVSSALVAGCGHSSGSPSATVANALSSASTSTASCPITYINQPNSRDPIETLPKAEVPPAKKVETFLYDIEGSVPGEDRDLVNPKGQPVNQIKSRMAKHGLIAGWGFAKFESPSPTVDNVYGAVAFTDGYIMNFEAIEESSIDQKTKQANGDWEISEFIDTATGKDTPDS